MKKTLITLACVALSGVAFGQEWNNPSSYLYIESARDRQERDEQRERLEQLQKLEIENLRLQNEALRYPQLYRWPIDCE